MRRLGGRLKVVWFYLGYGLEWDWDWMGLDWTGFLWAMGYADLIRGGEAKNETRRAWELFSLISCLCWILD